MPDLTGYYDEDYQGLLSGPSSPENPAGGLLAPAPTPVPVSGPAYNGRYAGMTAADIIVDMHERGMNQEGIDRVYELRQLGAAPQLPSNLTGIHRGVGRDNIRIYDSRGNVINSGPDGLEANRFITNFNQTAVDPFRSYNAANWLATAGMLAGAAYAAPGIAANLGGAGAGAGAAGTAAAEAAAAGGGAGLLSGAGAGAAGAAGAGTAAGIGAGTAAGLAALPEIVVTGTIGSGIGAGTAAGLGAAGAGGLLASGGLGSGASSGPVNYGDMGGFQPADGGLGIFENGGQAGMGSVGGGNAGALAESGAISGTPSWMGTAQNTVDTLNQFGLLGNNQQQGGGQAMMMPPQPLQQNPMAGMLLRKQLRSQVLKRKQKRTLDEELELRELNKTGLVS